MIFFLEIQFNGFHYSQQKFQMEMEWSRNLFLSVEFYYYFESNGNRNVYGLHYVTQKFSGLLNGIWKNFSFHFLKQNFVLPHFQLSDLITFSILRSLWHKETDCITLQRNFLQNFCKQPIKGNLYIFCFFLITHQDI